jgi:hypothetical protein
MLLWLKVEAAAAGGLGGCAVQLMSDLEAPLPALLCREARRAALLTPSSSFELFNIIIISCCCSLESTVALCPVRGLR